MMQVHGYTEHGDIRIAIHGREMTVPDDHSNGHRQIIAAWEAEGNIIPPYVTPVTTDEERRAAMLPLSARQFRLGLLDGGIDLADVETALAAITEPIERQKAQVEWEYATQFQRLHPLVIQLSGALGLTAEQVDAMWRAAAAL